MIKFKASRGKDGRELIGFGLTEKNVEALKRGEPIDIFGAEWGAPFDVVIFYGKDEQTMAADMRKAGLIDPEKTVLHDTSTKKTTRQ
jgi:hypothetical protein